MTFEILAGDVVIGWSELESGDPPMGIALGRLHVKPAYGSESESAAATSLRVRPEGEAVFEHPVTSVQTEYSLWSRDPEDDVLATCHELGIGFLAYSPLGRGFLTGQIKRFEDLPEGDFRRSSPRFQGDNFAKNLQLVAGVEQLARAKGCTASQLALAWVLAQGDFIVPIPRTKRTKYLEENVGAACVSLSNDDLAKLDAIAPRGGAAGPRYAEEGMRSIDR